MYKTPVNRIAEVIYIVPEERDAFLERELTRSRSVNTFLWKHGMRNQYYFKLGEYIIMTFSYAGDNFGKDMRAIENNPEAASYFIQTRRKDVPADKLHEVNWWAPMMKIGANLTVDPEVSDEFDPNQYDESVYKFYWDFH